MCAFVLLGQGESRPLPVKYHVDKLAQYSLSIYKRPDYLIFINRTHQALSKNVKNIFFVREIRSTECSKCAFVSLGQGKSGSRPGKCHFTKMASFSFIIYERQNFFTFLNRAHQALSKIQKRHFLAGERNRTEGSKCTFVSFGQGKSGPRPVKCHIAKPARYSLSKYERRDFLTFLDRAHQALSNNVKKLFFGWRKKQY